MKKFVKLVTMLVIGLVVTLSSCTSNEMYDYASADNMMVLSLSPKKLLANAGFQITADGIKAPEAIQNAIGNSSEVLTAMKCRGIDPDKALVVIDINADSFNRLCVIAKVTDDAQLKDYLKENNIDMLESDNGYDKYKLGYKSTILTKDGMLFIVSESPDAAVGLIDDLKAKAAEKPLASWQTDILDESDAVCGVINLEKMTALYSAIMPGIDYSSIYSLFFDEDVTKGYSTFTIDLDGSKAECESAMMNADGKKIKIKDSFPKINTAVLKYLDPNDQLMMVTSGVAGIDWSKSPLKMMPNGQEVIDVLKDINGTLAMSGAIDNAQELSDISGWHATFVAQFNAGAAERLKDMLVGMCAESGMDVSSEGNTTKISGRGAPEIYVLIDNDNLVVSLCRPISINENYSKKFGDDILAMTFHLKANSPNTTVFPLPFGVDFEAKCDNDGSEAELNLPGDNKPLLEKLIGLAMEM